MVEKKHISVVIPLYNKAMSIEKTIKAVLSQTFTDFEIIVVNDGSTDNSLEVVNSIKDERIRIITKANGGVSSARNKGINESNAGYIAFLDADDYWAPDYLEEMYKLIQDFPEASLYGCAYDLVENGISKSEDFHLPPLYRGIVDNYFLKAMEHLLYCSSAVIVKKKCIQKIGSFDERINMGEDLDMWFRMNLKYKGAFYNKTLAYYNIDGPNRAMKRKHDYKKSIMYYFDKYKTDETGNHEFRIFLNQFRCLKVFDLLANYDLNKKDLHKYISGIDFSTLSWKWRLFSKMPFLMKKYIANFYNK
jgi:glycosyltransferase involved in cell wall biosynthesis